MTSQGSDAILQRMLALHPKLMDLTLDRVWRLLGRLGNPQEKLPPVIHVAGTNGKGSTLAMIRAGLEGAGKTCHVYTSPHLARFHERIRLAGELISEDHLTEILDECYATNNEEQITYFEITTVAAILAFSRVDADYCLLEVGLGGRLDATNVVVPEISVITPVSIDHQQFLGDTLSEIAGEKAGILKRGATAIIARQDEDALETIEAQAQKVGAPLQVYGQHWHVQKEAGRLVFQDETGLLDLPLPSLLGDHQIENAGTALAVLRALKAGDEAYEAATRNAVWPARMQRLKSGPLVDLVDGRELWLDGGHNPAAGIAFAKLLKTLPKKPTFLICGMMNTKDVAGYMRPLAGVAEHLFAVSIPDEPNTLPGAATAEAAQSVGLSASLAQDAASAISETPAGCRIVICGSLYLAGAILRENG